MTTNFRNVFFVIAGASASFFYAPNLVLAANYSTPYSGITIEDKLDFQIGKNIFQKFWVPSPSSTTASDGLGPLYNTRSCNSCHINSGRGHAPETGINGASIPSFLVRLGKSYSDSRLVSRDHIYPNLGDKNYGHQFQGHSSPGIKPEGDFYLTYQTHIETLADGSQVELRKPDIHWTQLNYGQFEETTRFTLLVTPALVGMGLLGAISSDTILANADPSDDNQDGISGRVNWIPSADGTSKAIGRFGYKATTPSVSAQNQLAFNTDLGLSTPKHPIASGDCTQLQTDCINSPNGNSPHLGNLEADEQQARLVDLFVSLSAPPAMRNLTKKRFLQGKTIFENSGCISCHVPKMTTGDQSNFAVLNNRTFYPFTDMLLHDMGTELASGFPTSSATPNEWRTAPLWGIGISNSVSGRVGFLHDGRARSIEEAILWHGGEAKASQEHYKNLNQEYRKTLIYFLESL